MLTLNDCWWLRVAKHKTVLSEVIFHDEAKQFDKRSFVNVWNHHIPGTTKAPSSVLVARCSKLVDQHFCLQNVCLSHMFLVSYSWLFTSMCFFIGPCWHIKNRPVPIRCQQTWLTNLIRNMCHEFEGLWAESMHFWSSCRNSWSSVVIGCQRDLLSLVMDVI